MVRAIDYHNMDHLEPLRNADPALIDLIKKAKALAERHGWAPQLGMCICSEHLDFREALKAFDEVKLKNTAQT